MAHKIPVLVGRTVTLRLQFLHLGTTVPGTFAWSTSDATKATVAVSSENTRRAVVTGVAAGTATITATDGTLTTSYDVHVEAEHSPQVVIVGEDNI